MPSPFRISDANLLPVLHVAAKQQVKSPGQADIQQPGRARHPLMDHLGVDTSRY